jgi:hypothetical protein
MANEKQIRTLPIFPDNYFYLLEHGFESPIYFQGTQGVGGMFFLFLELSTLTFQPEYRRKKGVGSV